MKRLNLTNLETLCWIARLGSFSAAADRLNTTQPAISGRMRELETALNIKLFQRQGRRMELTIQGRELVERTQPLLGRLEDAVMSLDNAQAATGIIRIGVGEMVAVTWFGELMERVQREMPRVTYRIEVDLTVNMRQKLELGQLDLAIVAAPLDNNRLESTPLGSLDLLWVCAPALRAAWRRRGGEVRDLFAGQPVWCLARPSHMYPLAVEALRQHGVSLNAVSTSNSLQSMVVIVAAGGGIALLPENLVAGRIRQRHLAALSDLLPPVGLEFVIARHRDQDQAVIRRIIAATVEMSAFVKGGTAGAFADLD
ncbi:MAG: LysR family transcriptional regulator [Burkholderiales bacterium]